MCSSTIRLSLYAALIFVLSACERSPRQTAASFYDLDSLIDRQIADLSRLRPVLEKEADINGEREVIRLENADSSAWARELEIFRQLDLNAKTLNAGRYEIKTGLTDAGSNLNIIEYSATEALPLSQVRIYYQGNPKNVRRIEGRFRSNESNPLYSSGKDLSMELIDIGSQVMLSQYQVAGGQKMILGDSVRYQIVGALTYE